MNRAPYILTRRRFLQAISSAGAVSATGFLNGFNMASALAQTAPLTDYKALVCVFLFGGNDANNMIVPTDTAEYNLYVTGRGGSTANGGLALAQNTLSPIAPNSGGKNYGLHPSLAGLKPVFDAGKMAVVANVGTLVEPLSKADYSNAAKLKPSQLFSHSDQQAQWQTAMSSGIARTGWGGRMADAVGPANGTSFPMITSIAGASLFITGDTPRMVAIPTAGGGSFGLSGFNTTAASQARRTALINMADLNAGNEFVRESDDVLAQALTASSVINPIITATETAMTNIFNAANARNTIGNQLLQVAKLIQARDAIGVKRQIFFVSLGGFDTHTNEVATHNNLYGQLGPALKAFYDAMVALGVSDQVTTFTMSDFGRTLKPASGGGSDHGWGNHQFVIGGSVKGKELYGTFPNHTLGGPNDLSTNGRWIPTLAVDQYGATLAKWLGVSTTAMNIVFPNIGRFSNTDLGFMS